MKKMYRPLLKSSNWILTLLLGLLGITVVACSEDEYGTPYATYTVKGKVTNTEGQPINGIMLNTQPGYDRGVSTKTSPREPFLTDQEGNYTMTVNTVGPSDFMLYAFDVDGEDNSGLFQTDSILIKGSEIKLTGGDKHWNKGHGETTANFTLKEEKPAEDE